MKINKEILRIAAPAIVNNVTVPLLGLCDTAISGHLGSAVFLGAISVGTMMLNVIYWLFGFLRMGTTGLTAQAYGGSCWHDCRGILKKTLQIAVTTSIVVLLLQEVLLNLLLWVISPDSSVMSEAIRYYRICVWGVPAQLTIMAISGWYIGMQTTTIPMLIAVGVNILNIVLSVLLTVVFKVGFSGIAVGTLVANWVGAMTLCYLSLRKVKGMTKGKQPEETHIIRWGEMVGVNSHLFVRSMCIMGVTLAMTSYGARMGEATLAVNSIMMQFFIMFSYFMDGFAFSGEALVGKYVGGSDGAMARRVVNRLMLWGVSMAVIFFIIYFFGSRIITGLLTDNIDVIRGVDANKLWVCLLPPITVLAFIFDGIFIGLVRMREMMLVTLLSALIFFMIEKMMFSSAGNVALWGGFETYLFFRGVLLGLYYVIIERKKLNLL